MTRIRFKVTFLRNTSICQNFDRNIFSGDIAGRTLLYRRKNVIKPMKIILCTTDFAEISCLTQPLPMHRGNIRSCAGVVTEQPCMATIFADFIIKYSHDVMA
ncbi:hypothetical protein LV564_06660 [Komagataeibacter nataicola]|uniref:hypothetical protein n=1 Tax=Komagataeibacter nataicola TaxID=265960 RepID=UPI00125D5EDC|nr:hypothetical protein [Komagataeibacter nataicola]WEQ56751.1 hypothetical protein LV564_06660 [Komagataeibacter nataicola]WNM08224.1 hypothetical protein RI056_15210 [Komagataeibacter nataicola]